MVRPLSMEDAAAATADADAAASGVETDGASTAGGGVVMGEWIVWCPRASSSLRWRILDWLEGVSCWKLV